MTATTVSPAPATAAGMVLFTLATGQFLMTLDSSVMNVSIATVASDVGTSVTGIQTAITLYTLVMASLMIVGGRLGEILGRRRAFNLGCAIYGLGSFTTAIAPNLAWLIIGWSVLEGIGAALIMPAIVALVATNFDRARRPRAYGLVAASGAIAVAVGPLIGGLLTTYASWRWVFAGEVVLVVGIVALARRVRDAPPESRPRLDLAGAALSATGLGLIVFGILQGAAWGFVTPKPGGPSWLGLSPVIWLVLAGGCVLHLFVAAQGRQRAAGQATLVDPRLLANRQLRGGLAAFSLQYLLQAGLFFTVPLFLSVALGRSAIETGLRILPLSVTLLLAAIGVPRLFPDASPRRVVRLGFLALFAGITSMAAALEAGAGPEIITWPLLLAGVGIGSLASQLGSVTVSAVADEQSAEVGGLQNTFTNLGASLGTALSGAVLISVLSTSLLAGIEANPAVPPSVTEQAQTRLAGNVPFVANPQLEQGLAEVGVTGETARAVLDENERARLDALRAALALLSLLALGALFVSHRIPARQPASSGVEVPTNATTHDQAA